jgi:Na+/H+-translocating membrane pyrophosphatase
VRSVGSGRAAAVRLFVLVIAGISVVATIAGVLFAEIHGGTTVTRAVAYAFWFAAAFVLLAMAFAGSRALARRGVPRVDGWVFVSAAGILTAIGAVVDALGAPGT